MIGYFKKKKFVELVNSDIYRKVIFVAPYQVINLIRISVALRNRGIHTYLITKNKYMRFAEKYFTAIIVVGDFTILEKFNFDFLHIQGNNGVYFNYHHFTDKPIIYDFYDIDGMCHGVFNNVMENSIFNYYYKILAGYNINGIPEKYRQKTVEFHSYPLRQFFTSNNCKSKYSLIYAGCLCFPGSDSDLEFFENCNKYYDQGCCLDIYYSPQSKYQSKKHNVGNIKIFKGLELEEATRIFSKYGFGICINFNSDHHHYRIPSKFWHYLEAGLPVIVHENMKYHAEIVKNNNIGVVINDDDNIREKIDQHNYSELVKNVYKYREKICMDTKIDALVAIYTKLWRT